MCLRWVLICRCQQCQFPCSVFCWPGVKYLSPAPLLLLLIFAYTHLHSVWPQCPAQGATVMHEGRRVRRKRLWTWIPVKDDISMRQFLGFTTCCFFLELLPPYFHHFSACPHKITMKGDFKQLQDLKDEGQRQCQCNEWELKEIAIQLSPVHL